ncbi:MAG TPA: S-layer homology domain-containing protein [Arthrobacter sp.]|nr:S-layer homology domain-containing protein [Arthrobacter sp.]
MTESRNLSIAGLTIQVKAVLSAVTALTIVFASLLIAPAANAAPPGAPEPQPVDGAPKIHHHYEPGKIPGVERSVTPDGVMEARRLHPAGDVKVTLVRAVLDNNAGDYRTVSLDAARQAINVADDYWSDMSNGRISIKVEETKPRFYSKAKAGWNYWDIMAQITKELNWKYEKGKALVIFIPQDKLSGGAYGAGWTTEGVSGRILMPRPDWNSLTDSVLSHEFGHLFGLGHANSLTCKSGASDTPDYSGCWVRAYGDSTDLMGLSQNYRPTISASFWDIAGFGSGRDVRNVGIASGSKTYTLLPWGGEKSYRALKFTDPVSKETYYLELRQPVDQDRYLAYRGEELNNGVKITQVPWFGKDQLPDSIILEPNTRPFSGYYSKEHAWQEGSTFVTHAGTKVKIKNIRSGSARVTITAPGGQSTDDPFKDVNGDTKFQQQILWAYNNDITNGYDDGTFRPYDPINRDAMAAFLYRLAGEPRYNPPNTSPFTDYRPGDKFYKEIAWLEETGITNGWKVGRNKYEYRPLEPINRDAMAAFLYRMAGKPAYTPPRNSPFKDYGPGDKFYKEVAWLENTGITTGWPDGTYRPVEPINRDAMVTFLWRFDKKF